jgi:hypothetical protein
MQHDHRLTAAAERGPHENLMTQRLRWALDTVSESEHKLREVKKADQPLVAARYVQQLTHRALEGAANPEERLKLVIRSSSTS